MGSGLKSISRFGSDEKIGLGSMKGRSEEQLGLRSLKGGSEVQMKERYGRGLTREKSVSEFKCTFGSRSSTSKMTKLTTTISVGLNGLAGKPGISQSESESWIVDPRTPIKKFSALLFKLAGIRQALLQ